MQEDTSQEEDNEIIQEPLIKKDKSLLYMLVILGGIILMMGYLTLFVDDPWKLFNKNETAVTVTDDRPQLLNESSSMSDEEVRQSLVKFIQAFYYDQQRGYFDPPSYFAPITETFYNYHNLTYQRLKDIYWKRKEDMENLRRNWIVSSLNFERLDSRITVTYWAKESFFKRTLQENQSMDVKYEMVIDENGKIVSLKDIETKNLEVIKLIPDTTLIAETTDFEDPSELATSGNQVYDMSVVEQLPEFPGGQKEWQKYLSANLKYPQAAKANKVQGKVFVSIVVEKDGAIHNVKIRQGIGSGCDEEAIRLFKASPSWKPGMIKGSPVSTYCIFPVSFQL